MPNRMTTLYERAKPSRGSLEHQELHAALRGVEPGPDHPRYDDFVRLTEPKPRGRPVADEVLRGERPKAGGAEYERWRREHTETGRATYQRQLARQVQDYHSGPYGSGARDRADQRTRARRVQEAMDFYGITDLEAARQLAEQHPSGEFPAPLTTAQYEEEGKTRWWPEEEPVRGHSGGPVPDTHGVRVSQLLQRAAAVDWDETRTAATKRKPAKPKVRKPEEVWYDVHKHPEGTPGGMGKSPEHHLRNRGWSPYEIHGATAKTIQYHNPNFPDFSVSYGGGSSTKPDHNFRVLYMGGSRHVPKVTRAYSVAEAMNKVEELHQLATGDMVVRPMTHDASLATQPSVSQQGTFVAPDQVDKRRDMNLDDAFDIGAPATYTVERFPTRPDEASDWRMKGGNRPAKPGAAKGPKKPQKPKQNPADKPVGATTKSMMVESALLLAQQENWES